MRSAIDKAQESRGDATSSRAESQFFQDELSGAPAAVAVTADRYESSIPRANTGHRSVAELVRQAEHLCQRVADRRPAVAVPSPVRNFCADASRTLDREASARAQALICHKLSQVCMHDGMTDEGEAALYRSILLGNKQETSYRRLVPYLARCLYHETISWTEVIDLLTTSELRREEQISLLQATAEQCMDYLYGLHWGLAVAVRLRRTLTNDRRLGGTKQFYLDFLETLETSFVTRGASQADRSNFLLSITGKVSEQERADVEDLLNKADRADRERHAYDTDAMLVRGTLASLAVVLPTVAVLISASPAVIAVAGSALGVTVFLFASLILAPALGIWAGITYHCRGYGNTP